MKVFTPPQYPDITMVNSIFLAGSIEMGKAWDWQKDFILRSSAKVDKDPYLLGRWIILNPRRGDWDDTWQQDISNPYFYQQVEWEMTYLERATHRVFYFAEDTLSPITLWELGKFGEDKNTYVVVEPGFLRKGNVDIICHRYQIPQCGGISDIISKLF